MNTLTAASLAASLITAAGTAGTAAAATSTRVMFQSNGQRLVGDLYLPDDYRRGDRLQAIVVTGAWTTVKEQMPAEHAAAMADRGYAALAFDFRNWGQSEGDQRQLEHPELKTQDIVAAAAFLAARPEVNPERVLGLGVCASAGYMADATARSPHLRAVALVAPWLHNAEVVDAVYGAENVERLVAMSRKAQSAFEAAGRLTTVPAAGPAGSDAVMQSADYYANPERGLIPEYDNLFNVASWEPWLTYDAIATAERLAETPVHIVHSEKAAIPQGAKAFFARLEGPRSQLWIESATQFDFYDDPDVITRWAESVDDFFRNVRD